MWASLCDLIEVKRHDIVRVAQNVFPCHTIRFSWCCATLSSDFSNTTSLMGFWVDLISLLIWNVSIHFIFVGDFYGITLLMGFWVHIFHALDIFCINLSIFWCYSVYGFWVEVFSCYLYWLVTSYVSYIGCCSAWCNCLVLFLFVWCLLHVVSECFSFGLVNITGCQMKFTWLIMFFTWNFPFLASKN